MNLTKGGYNCNGPCINDNTPYFTWAEAWEKCAMIETCIRVMRWENGSHYNYYLRKADDIFVDNDRFLHVDFDPKCKNTGKNSVKEHIFYS